MSLLVPGSAVSWCTVRPCATSSRTDKQDLTQQQLENTFAAVFPPFLAYTDTLVALDATEKAMVTDWKDRGDSQASCSARSAVARLESNLYPLCEKI